MYAYWPIKHSSTADAALYYNCSFSHPSIFYQPLLILNQSHGWGRGPTHSVRTTGRNTPWTGLQSITGHKRSRLGAIQSLHSAYCACFLECGCKVSPGIKAPSLKSNPEPSCCLIHEVLFVSCGDHSPCSCVISLSAKHEFPN